MTDQKLIKVVFSAMFIIILLLSSIIAWLLNADNDHQRPPHKIPTNKIISKDSQAHQDSKPNANNTPILDSDKKHGLKTNPAPAIQPNEMKNQNKSINNNTPLEENKEPISEKKPKAITNKKLAKNLKKNTEKPTDLKADPTKIKKEKEAKTYFYDIDLAKIKRNPGFAKFLLLDHRSKLLAKDTTVKVYLWRIIGRYYSFEDIIFDPIKSTIYCKGADGFGLENGHYRIEIISDEYGKLSHPFRISRYKLELNDILYMPFYRKIISFQFTNKDNEPIKYLPFLPELTIESPPKPRVLNGSIHSSIFINDHRLKRDVLNKTKPLNISSKHLTDNGVLYFPVYVGNSSRLKIPFKNEKEFVLNTTSKFNEDYWDHYKININGSQEFLDSIESRKKLANKNDPGYKSLKKTTNNKMKLESIFIVPDKVKPDQALTIFTISANTPLSLRYQKSRNSTTSIAVKPQGNRIFLNLTKTNLSNTDYINFAFTDEKFFLSDWQMHIPDYGHKKYQRASYYLSPIKLELKATPTLKEMLQDRATVKGKGGINFNFEKVDSRLILKSHIDPNDTNDTKTYRGLSLYFNRFSSSIELAKAPFPINNTTLKLIKRGQHQFKNPIKGIALRVIGAENAGLPWVEAAVIPMKEEDDILFKLERFNKRFGKHLRSTLHHWAKGLVSKNIDRRYYTKSIKNRSDGFKLAKELIPYFANFNKKLKHYKAFTSDARGYLFLPKNDLKPGANYLLYLYSKSKNILEPDKRIPFTAKEGVTDLGAFQLISISNK